MGLSKINGFNAILIAFFFFLSVSVVKVSAETTFFDQGDAFIMGNEAPTVESVEVQPITINPGTGFWTPFAKKVTVEVPPLLPAKCVEGWSCTGWSDCASGTRTRACTDANACGTVENKPPESEACTIPAENMPLGVPLGILSLAFLVVAALAIYVAMKKHGVRRKGAVHTKRVKR
jgi:hypothetical protein